MSSSPTVPLSEMDPADHVSAGGVALLVLLLVAGLAAIWRWAAGPAARAAGARRELPHWKIPVSDFLLFLLLVFAGAIGGAFLCQLAALWLRRSVAVNLELLQLSVAAGQQLGMLAGFAAHTLAFSQDIRRAPPRPWGTFLGGVATFLVALPPVWAISFGWQNLLQALHLPVKEQDTLALFEGLHTTSGRVGFVVVAAIGAPVAEELLFRAGLFRFCLGRLPRWLALWLPALLFGAAHLFPSATDGLASLVPLVVLGAIFSLAYERTGRIGTTMVAHGLFNLTTIALVLLGVNT